MVAAQQEEVLRILHFVGQEQAHRGNTVMASVNVVSEEEVIRLRREHPTVKMVKKIFELTVDVAQDVYWRHQFQQNWLLHKYLFSGRNELANLLFLQDVRQVLIRSDLGFVDCIAGKLVIVD